MPTLTEALELIRRNAKAWGVYLSPPLSLREIAATKSAFEASFQVSFPADYERLLAFSNGIETQRGSLFDSKSLHVWNDEHWRRTPTIRDLHRGGALYESFPSADPRPLEYLWIGSYGNMDMYSFQLLTRQYHVTNLGFDCVYDKFGELGDFLLYLADQRIEFE